MSPETEKPQQHFGMVAETIYIKTKVMGEPPEEEPPRDAELVQEEEGG